MNYAEDVWPQEKWDTFDHTKVLLQNEDGPSERIWARMLPNGGVALDNHPINPDYRWQDVLDVQTYTVIARRWNTELWFHHLDFTDDDEASMALRKRMIDAFAEEGLEVSFIGYGLARALFEIDNETECEDLLAALLVEHGWVADNT